MGNTNPHVFGNNRPYVDKYKGRITNAGQRYGVDPAVLGGLVNGSGDNGNVHGLMQVDKHCHRPQGAWDSQEHIEQDKKYPHWTKEQKLKGALADYNMGPGSISSYEEVDAKTTGGDYSNQINILKFTQYTRYNRLTLAP
uniref:Lysozyme g n=1 Tax=Oncorhynchus tshawytscha TaxID=74940 RepID=A0AAZ3QSG7_ONCTS